MDIRTDILDTAKSYLGVVGGSPQHKEIVDTYNSHPLARGYLMKTSDDWCAGFVSVVAIVTGNTDIIPTEVSVPNMVSMAQANGTWVESDDFVPQQGDIIVYSWSDSGVGDATTGASHIGYVDFVRDGYIYVVEGNMGNAVGVRKIAVNGRYIRGFICPEYERKENSMRYQTIDQIPDYAKPTVQKMVDTGILLGTGDGLNLSDDMVRTFVILDRAGKL